MSKRQEKWNKKYVGGKVGRLEIIKVILGDKITLECLCECGRRCVKSIESIYQKRKTLSCGCSVYQYKKGNKSYKWKGFGEISSKFWYREKANAIRRNIDFSITIEEAWNKFVQQNRRCSFSNEILHFPRDSFSNGTASLDRIDPLGSYTVENTRWIHKDINNMKWDLTDKEFFLYCKLLLNPIESVLSDDCIEKIHGKSWKGYGNISGDLWTRINKNAKTRGIDILVSIEDIWNLFLSQKGCCGLTGLQLTLSGKRFSASLDRKNSSREYNKDNIVWIHKDINCKIKKDLPLEKIYFWCNKIKEMGLLK